LSIKHALRDSGTVEFLSGILLLRSNVFQTRDAVEHWIAVLAMIHAIRDKVAMLFKLKFGIGIANLVPFSTVAGIDTAQNAIEFIVIESYTCSDGSSKWAGLQPACAAA
jgi:hypothetical protein